MAKTTLTSLGIVQLLYQLQAGFFYPGDDHLCNPVTMMNLLGFIAQG